MNTSREDAHKNASEAVEASYESARAAARALCWSVDGPFALPPTQRTDYAEHECSLNDTEGCRVVQIDQVGPWYLDVYGDAGQEITYCPFCGEKLEIVQ